VKLQVSFEELREHGRRKSRELARKAKQVVVMDCHTAAAEAVERLSSAEAVKAVCHKLEAAKHEEKTAAQRQEMCNASSWWRKEPHPHAAYVPPQRRSMDVVRSTPLHPPPLPRLRARSLVRSFTIRRCCGCALLLLARASPHSVHGSLHIWRRVIRKPTDGMVFHRTVRCMGSRVSVFVINHWFGVLCSRRPSPSWIPSRSAAPWMCP
jgi:hypothetical protein